jgi:hypothetical protein
MVYYLVTSHTSQRRLEYLAKAACGPSRRSSLPSGSGQRHAGSQPALLRYEHSTGLAPPRARMRFHSVLSMPPLLPLLLCLCSRRSCSYSQNARVITAFCCSVNTGDAPYNARWPALVASVAAVSPPLRLSLNSDASSLSRSFLSRFSQSSRRCTSRCCSSDKPATKLSLAWRAERIASSSDASGGPAFACRGLGVAVATASQSVLQMRCCSCESEPFLSRVAASSVTLSARTVLPLPSCSLCVGAGAARWSGIDLCGC